MTLRAVDVGGRDRAEGWLGRTVWNADVQCFCKLVSIYDDAFETTVGVCREIDVEDKGAKCKYVAKYAEFLPVMYKSRPWSFPDGSVGELTLGVMGEKYVSVPFLNEGTGKWFDVVEDTEET